MMGLALQGQGELDLAFEQFKQVPISPELMGHLCHLAIDFERQRHADKAQAVYDHMANVARRERNTVKTQPPAAPQLETQTNPLPFPKQLGHYRLQKTLGQGSMGVVYLGKDLHIDRWVAIKTLALTDAFEGNELVDARERFFREAKAAGKLQHPNIVTVFDAGEDQNLAFIAMEFLHGHDLSMFCKPGRLLPVPTVLSIVTRVALALDYAHQQQVVHRDIKPANVMFDAKMDTVKITDFGVARLAGASKTKTGLVLGSPSFMSPEQLSGQLVDGRSDLYALGVMMFQMLTGELPLRGQSMAELMHHIAHQDAPDIRTRKPELSEPLAQIVRCSLQKLPQSRHQTGQAFADALQALSSRDIGAVTTIPLDFEL